MYSDGAMNSIVEDCKKEDHEYCPEDWLLFEWSPCTPAADSGPRRIWTPDRRETPRALDRHRLRKGWIMEKRSVLHVLTVVDPVTNVASPAPLVDELDERIDVGAALPTSAKTK